MNLNEYCKTTKTKNADIVFALKKLGIATVEGQIHQLRYGRKPSTKLAKAIEAATDGAVSRFELLYPDEFKKAV